MLRKISYILNYIFPASDLEREYQSGEIYRYLDNIYKVKEKDNIAYIFPYLNPKVKKLIWEMKYTNARYVSKVFAYYLAKEISQLTGEYIIIPVPIHRKRRKERGYNQCEWICRDMMRYLPKRFSYKPKLIKRVKYTEKLSKVSLEQREKEIVGSFKLTKTTDKAVILVDDIFTTGVTVNQISKLFKKINIFTVAH